MNNNYDNMPLESAGISQERQLAIDIMEYLGVCTDGDKWYEYEDEVTEMIISHSHFHTNLKRMC